jgi:hypothetical protein
MWPEPRDRILQNHHEIGLVLIHDNLLELIQNQG